MFDHPGAQRQGRSGASTSAVDPTFSTSDTCADPGGIGTDGHGPVVAAPRDAEAREARVLQLLHALWLEDRPDWTTSDWWDAPLRDEVRELLWLPAGPALSGALADVPLEGSCPLAHADEAPPGWPAPGHAPGWPCACAVVVAAAWEACAAWVAAGAAASLVHAAGPSEVTFCPPPPARQVRDPAREELAVALRVSPTSMGNRIAAARELMSHPRLHGLVASAAVSAWGARLVAQELVGLPDELAQAVVDELADRVHERLTSGRRPWTSAEIGRAVRMIRLRRAPEHEKDARQRAFADGKVQVLPDRHGMAVLSALLDATDAHRIHRRLTAIAQGMDDPERSRDQVRADTLVDLLLGGVGDLRGSERGGQPPLLPHTGDAGTCGGAPWLPIPWPPIPASLVQARTPQARTPRSPELRAANPTGRRSTSSCRWPRFSAWRMALRTSPAWAR